MTDWPVLTLEDICSEGGGFVRTGPFGAQLHKSDYVDDPDGIPVVMPKNMSGGSINFSDIARVDQATAERLSDHLLAAGDVALSRRGDVGRSAYIEESDLPVLCGTGSMRIHLGEPESVRPEFLRYFFRSPLASNYLEAHAVGATMPNLNASIVNAMPVLVPPLGVQSRIGATLGSLDELIENNRRRVEVLEEMARVIYREWFVHFRFPGHEDVTSVDSDLGPIPDGWASASLGEIATAHRKTVHPKRRPDTMFCHYSIPAFDNGQLPVIEPGASIRSGKYVVDGLAVMVSKLNPRIPRTWFVEPAPGSHSVASTEFVILTPLADKTAEWIYLTATSQAFEHRLKQLSGGTSGSHQRLRPNEMLAVPVLEPANNLVARVTDAVRPGLGLARRLRLLSHRLAAIRDLLLPKLVTGQIDVSGLDLDATVELVVA